MSRHRPLILHFEDDIEDRLMFALGMEDAGFEVIPARTPAETLRLAREAKPDAIVLDIMYYDELDAGIRLCEELKRGPEPVTARVVMMSNRGDADARLKSELSGADSYVEKGDVEKCAIVIRELLESAP